jgi:transcription elongation factor Elf1
MGNAICCNRINIHNLFTCIWCNASLHESCYIKNRTNIHYTQCPNCNHIGCIGKHRDDNE